MNKKKNYTRFLNKLIFIIPARMNSSRFYGKPLKNLNGKTVVERVYKNCLESSFCKKVIIATDSKKIFSFCKKNKFNVMMTKKHNCASNRVAEVAYKLKDKWIVEMQGDEPLLFTNLIDGWLKKILDNIDNNNKIDVYVSTAKLNYNLADNPNFVKLIKDKNDIIKWFSRSKIPSDWKGLFKSNIYRHTGFHLWKNKSLNRFSSIKPCPTEVSEDTHAVRLVNNDFIPKSIFLKDTQSIDVPADLKKAEAILKSIKI